MTERRWQTAKEAEAYRKTMLRRLQRYQEQRAAGVVDLKDYRLARPIKVRPVEDDE